MYSSLRSEIIIIELTPLQIHNGRYSDKYMNKARIDATYSRFLCYGCGNFIYQWDPNDHNYIKCHHCGERKRVPQNIETFTPDWGNEQRRRDGMRYLFG